MNADRRAPLLTAIREWVSIQPEENATPRLPAIEAELDRPGYAWIEADAMLRAHSGTNAVRRTVVHRWQCRRVRVRAGALPHELPQPREEIRRCDNWRATRPMYRAPARIGTCRCIRGSERRATNASGRHRRPANPGKLRIEWLRAIRALAWAAIPTAILQFCLTWKNIQVQVPVRAACTPPRAPHGAP